MRPAGERLAEGGLAASALASSLVTVAILLFLLVMGLPLLRGGLILQLLGGGWQPDQGQYGIAPMLAGTLLIAPLGLLIALPLCLGVSALVTVLGQNAVSTFIRGFVRFMTGIPTVVYGFVGVFLLVPLVRELFGHGSGMCVLSAALLLAVLISPTMILFFTEAFAGVPESYRRAVDALGGTRVQALVYVILPQAWRGVLSGTIMGMGRAFGDTMIALMIAGNAARVPDSLLDPARTLTSHIALIKAADYESLEFKSIFACGLVLYLITAVLAVAVRGLARDEGAAR